MGSTLFTDHRGLSAEGIIAIYKSGNLVEEGDRSFKIGFKDRSGIPQ